MKLPSLLYLHDKYIRDLDDLKKVLKDKSLIQQEAFKIALLAYIRNGLLQSWLDDRKISLKIDMTKKEDSTLYQSVLEQLTGEVIEIRKSKFKDFCKSVEVCINGVSINDGEFFTFTDSETNILSIKLVSETACNESFDIDLINPNKNEITHKTSINWTDMTRGKEKTIDIELKEYTDLKLLIEDENYGHFFHSIIISGKIDGHDFVDLALPSGAKWATCNIGSTKLLEHGGFFAWGEINTKGIFRWSNYKWGTSNIPIKYGTCYTAKLRGYKLLLLEPVDDTATSNWGNNWRMPTSDEFKELIDGCNWTWTNNFEGNNVTGYIGTSKTNNKRIFFPAAGFRDDHQIKYDRVEGSYWAATCTDSSTDSSDCMCFSQGLILNTSRSRCMGFNVRAILKS